MPTAIAPAIMLAATAFTETTLLLFLHIVAAMTTMTGVVALPLLHARLRRAASTEEIALLLRLLRLLSGKLLQSAVAVTGILGFLLTYRYDARALFAWERQGWLHLAIVLWVLLQVVAGQAIRAIRRGLRAADATDQTTGAPTRLGAPVVVTLVWSVPALIVVIVYLMVFQPFVSS